MLRTDCGVDVDGAEFEELRDGNEMKLLLDILYENNIMGGGEVDENVPFANDDNFDDNNDGAGDDFENNMIFEGPDYSVNFHRHIDVKNIRDLEFDGGAVRETVYRVHLNASWGGVNLSDIMGGLEGVLEDIIGRLNESYNPHDLVRFFIQNEAFYSPHSLGLMPLHQLSIFKIFELLETLLQSDDELYLDEPLEIHVGVIRNPLGAGRSLGLNYIDDLHRLRCICKINNDDNLCLARAITVGVARADMEAAPLSNRSLRRQTKSAYYHVINPKRKLQKVRAVQLHTRAGFDVNHVPAFTDIPAFEREANTRIVVFGRGSGVKPLYAGAMTRQRTVYLLYVDHPLRQGAVGHFHTITRVRCIFGKSAFCDKCLQPYDKRYGHRGCEQCVSCRGNQCTVVFD